MSDRANKSKIEYGDFQTPIELAERICTKLHYLGVRPDLIVEPTCGIGNFLEAAIAQFQSASTIVGIEINPDRVEVAKNNPIIRQDPRVAIANEDFLNSQFLSDLEHHPGQILVLGNLPWITNSQQGRISGKNLPKKSNFQKHKGSDALTGKSNFDLSEWMLIQIIEWLQERESGHIGMLCKTAIARKILYYLRDRDRNLSEFATYRIDAKTHFNAAVEACFLYCHFRSGIKQYFCDVFPDLDSSESQRIGFYHQKLIPDIVTFKNLSFLYSESEPPIKWRSGIKHDCSKIMELRQSEHHLVNGLGETVEMEEDYIFPLLKGSDIANGKVGTTQKYVLATQKRVGEKTDAIAETAPKTWDYLEKNAKYLDARKSKIYQKNPRFSVFGVGDYTFKPWKIAICGLYKKLDFQLVGAISGKPVLFDDTVYFLSFDTREEAVRVFEMLTSPEAIAFYSSLIFWDEKRPIKTGILNTLNLQKLEMTLNNQAKNSSTEMPNPANIT